MWERECASCDRRRSKDRVKGQVTLNPALCEIIARTRADVIDELNRREDVRARLESRNDNVILGKDAWQAWLPFERSLGFERNNLRQRLSRFSQSYLAKIVTEVRNELIRRFAEEPDKDLRFYIEA